MRTKLKNLNVQQLILPILSTSYLGEPPLLKMDEFLEKLMIEISVYNTTNLLRWFWDRK